MANNDLGLAYYTFVLPDKEAFESLLTHLEKENVSLTLESSRRFGFIGSKWHPDQNGILGKMIAFDVLNP